MDLFTQYSFVNKGTMPATEVRIKLTYPVGTQIKKITPKYTYKEYEKGDSKIVELCIKRMAVNMPLPVLLRTEHAPTGPPETRCNEDNEWIEFKEGHKNRIELL